MTIHTGGTLTLLFVAVPHGDALQAVRGRHGCRGFLDSEPVVNGLVALVVQRAVQYALQPEVTVRLLNHKNKEQGERFNSLRTRFDFSYIRIRLKRHSCHGQLASIEFPTKASSHNAFFFFFFYLDNLDESFELVNMQLLIQPVRQPHAHRLHERVVPLLCM